MNTILISGGFKPNKTGIEYNINIWGSLDGQPLQLVTNRNVELSGYTDLWRYTKVLVAAYFDTLAFSDGAYTQYLDHLIRIN